MRLPRLYLGTMTFAWNQASSPVDDKIATAFIQRFVAAGGRQVDTALQSSGASDLLVGSKAAPSQPGGLSATGMRSQLDASLGAIGVERLAEYYLHQPDTEAALLESLREAHAMVSEGKVGAVGMSNYHASEVARAFELCAEHGLTKPSVYQGLYNPLNRAVEEELLPVLRAHGCSFVAFNPLAAGLLTGAHKRDGEVRLARPSAPAPRRSMAPTPWRA
jgi:aflatoxin B1 aldehyde reductase